MTLNVINIYGLNIDNPSFFKQIQIMIQNIVADYSVICGDFNLVLDPQIDTYNYKHKNNPNARLTVLHMMSELDLIDIFRHLFPDKRRFTWRRRCPVKQARLDFFLVSDNMTDIISNCDVKPRYRSDHSIIELDILINKFIHRKGVWKFNNSLLNNQDYLTQINKAIDEEILQYALPVYNLEFLKENFENLMFTIDNDTFLEMLFLRIRGLGGRRMKKELIHDNSHLESCPRSIDTNIQLITDKRIELETLREAKVKDEQV